MICLESTRETVKEALQLTPGQFTIGGRLNAETCFLAQPFRVVHGAHPLSSSTCFETAWLEKALCYRAGTDPLNVLRREDKRDD